MSTEPTVLTLPARRGLAVRAKAGQRFSVVNTHGTQVLCASLISIPPFTKLTRPATGHKVVDTWAFVDAPSADGELREWMSMEHSRVGFKNVSPQAGDALRTNAQRRPLLTLLEDSSPGRHDTLCAACDPFRYRLLGVESPHDNCTDNLAAALATLGLQSRATPCPLNLFMLCPVMPSGEMVWSLPNCKAGDAVTFRVEIDAVLAFSCCPMDVAGNPINGNQPVRDCELRLFAA